MLRTSGREVTGDAAEADDAVARSSEELRSRHAPSGTNPAARASVLSLAKSLRVRFMATFCISGCLYACLLYAFPFPRKKQLNDSPAEARKVRDNFLTLAYLAFCKLRVESRAAVFAAIGNSVRSTSLKLERWRGSWVIFLLILGSATGTKVVLLDVYEGPDNPVVIKTLKQHKQFLLGCTRWFCYGFGAAIVADTQLSQAIWDTRARHSQFLKSGN